MTTRRTTVLDPKKRAVGFTTEHISHVDHPGNGKAYLLIQDSYTSDLGDAISRLASIVGPLMQYMSQECYNALNQCYQYLSGDQGMGGMPRMYSALSDDEKQAVLDAFEYGYPDAAVITEIVNGLASVPEGVDMYEPAQAITRALSTYTPEAWVLSADHVYCATNALKAEVVDHVVRTAAEGGNVAGLAALAQRLEPDHGVLVGRNTPLWPLVVTEGEPEARTDPEPQAQSQAAAPAATVQATSGYVAPISSQPAAVAAPQDQDMKPDYIRSIMAQADPVVAALDNGTVIDGQPVSQQVRVEPVQPVAQGDGSAVVNLSNRGAGGLSDMSELERALSVPGLTEVQKRGIIRAFSSSLEERYIAQEPPATGGMDAAAMRSVVQEAVTSAVSVVTERLDQLEQRIDGRPTRRSIVTLPQQAEPQVQRSRFAPRSIAELAETNTL